MPNVGSIVRLGSGQLGIVTAVTPKGDGDRILLLGRDTPFRADVAWEIHEILYEPEVESTRYAWEIHEILYEPEVESTRYETAVNPWLLFPVSVSVLYVGGQILRLVFSLIDRAHSR